MLIFRRTNCITIASGIVTLCKWPYRTPVESGLLCVYTVTTLEVLRLILM